MDTFDKPVHIDGAANGRSTRGVSLLKMVVYQEKHAPDANGQHAIHYHVPLQASCSFRFQAYKRALKEKYGLASHWSSSHDGYWSAV
eukprot:1504942-Karenia_brevis.AAC.1